MIDKFASAKDLIAFSVSHTTIAHGANVGTQHEDLMVACEDHVDANNVIEFWGTDDDGSEWRVHLDR